MNAPTRQEREEELDPVYLHALREAKVVLVIFGLFAAYTLGVSYVLGYDGQAPADSAAVPTILGIPSWVFWAIVLPWGLANVATAWFCFGFMKDDPLGELVQDPSEEHPPTATLQGENDYAQ